ncbi:MAG TPA: protein-glutamate O-methyltransferase CheR [Candidatus Baltobacteraceae bacterium]|nr:protein-glutamate O-methyltransferase CheR [Candidatus Baltobacteraceae bacterium]
MAELIDHLTIGETYFFRDPELFGVLRARVVQQLQESGFPTAPFRLWSAGCSSGEEAYSLAIMMAQVGLIDRTYVLASDLSQGAIEKARSASYTQWSFRDKAPSWRAQWLDARSGSWVVAPDVRSNVECEVQNLATASPPDRSPFDVILCRNVLMYLEPDVAQLVLQRLAASLSPGGWLLTSPADPVQAEAGLEAVITSAGIVYRRPSRPVEPQTPPAMERPILVSAPLAHPVARKEHIEELLTAGATHADELDPERHIALAIMLLDLGLASAAVAPARRAILLDRTLAVAHLILGRALRIAGRQASARRAVRRAVTLLTSLPPNEVVKGAGGSTAAVLTAHATAELSMLDCVITSISQ